MGVRTVFRHYPTRDLLIADATKEMVDALTAPIVGLPDPAQDIDGWLAVLALEIHTRLATILGRAFWDLRMPDPSDHSTYAQSLAGRQTRVEGVSLVTSTAWSAVGGRGDPPQWLVEVFTLFFSAFVTNGLSSDFGNTPEQTAALTAKTLKVLLLDAVEGQGAT